MQISDFKMEMWPIMYQTKANMKKFIEPILQTEGLSMIQAYILIGISEGNLKNISSLCKQLDLNQGNVSTVCKHMEKSGLIKRNRSLEDERVVTLSITELGEETLGRLQAREDKLDAVFEQIPIEKLETIIKGMHEFSELLRILSEKNNL